MKGVVSAHRPRRCTSAQGRTRSICAVEGVGGRCGARRARKGGAAPRRGPYRASESVSRIDRAGARVPLVPGDCKEAPASSVSRVECWCTGGTRLWPHARVRAAVGRVRMRVRDWEVVAVPGYGCAALACIIGCLVPRARRVAPCCSSKLSPELRAAGGAGSNWACAGVQGLPIHQHDGWARVRCRAALVHEEASLHVLKR